MGRWLTIVGLIGMILSAIYFVYFDQTKAGEGFDYISHTRTYFMISLGLVIVGYVVRIVENKLGVGAGKCRRCGRRVEKNEMYCFDHLKHAVNNAVDRDHRTGR
jgi:hypothetical protein